MLSIAQDLQEEAKCKPSKCYSKDGQACQELNVQAYRACVNIESDASETTLPTIYRTFMLHVT